MAEIITHSFVSAKTQSADTTKVSKNEWNDGHAFNNGINGQHLIYDNTQPNNQRWTDGARIYSVQTAIVTSTGTPLLNAAQASVVIAQPCVGLAAIFVGGFSTVGNATGTFSHRVDDVASSFTVSVVSPTTAASFVTILTLSAGTHVIDIDVTVAGNANILTLQLIQSILIFGV